MKILINRLIKRENNKLSENRGQSYLEFSIMIMIIITIFYTVFEVFWLINAQVLLTNTAKSALREVEVYGQAKSNLETNVRDTLQRVKNLHSINILINDQPINTATIYQLRDPIKLTLRANYNITILNNAYRTTAAGRYTSVPLAATYHGISQRLNKDGTSPIIVTE